jgi:Pyruvate dehydrogenase complex, dehydrogenase (E1) component
LRWNQLHPDKKPKKTYIQKCLKGRSGPIIAASDYIRSHIDQIRPYVENSFYTLGTDGYGRSDTRKELRKFFEVNKKSIVVNTLSALSKEQKIASKVVNDAIKKYKIDPEKPYPIKL